MNTIIKSLDNISSNEMCELVKILKVKIEERVETEKTKVMTILKQIKKYGYMCTIKTTYHDKLCNGDIFCMQFPLFVKVYTDQYNDEHIRNIYLDSDYDQCDQNEWAYLLDYDFGEIENEKGNIDLSNTIGPWKNINGRMKNISSLKLNVYYKYFDQSDDNIKFKAFCRTGNTEEWKIVDNHVYCEDHCLGLCPVNKKMWKIHKIFVVPGSIESLNDDNNDSENSDDQNDDESDNERVNNINNNIENQMNMKILLSI